MKFKKALPCYFYHINSINKIEVGPVGLDRAFHKLPKYIKFVKFGQVDLSLLKFEKETSNGFQTELNYSNLNNWAGGKRDGPAQLRAGARWAA